MANLRKLVPEGERYQVAVPDTLDLAERAELAMNGTDCKGDPTAPR